MAEDRYFFWRGYWDALQLLPSDAQRGRFVMAICDFAFEGRQPDFSDDPVLGFGWTLVRDAVHESVEMGRRQSERGRRGGRPRKGGKSESTEKSGAKSGAESTAESGAESVRYGIVPSGCAASLDAQPLAAPDDPVGPAPMVAASTYDDPWAGVEPPDLTDEEAEARLASLGITARDGD